jgi:predicted porin
MKNNKWTVGLAAAGLIGLASVAQAQDANSVQTKLATTSLSGYVSTTYTWAMGDAGGQVGDGAGTNYNIGGDKRDRFALDVISLTLASPKSAGDWGAGYNVQLWLGPDASEILSGDDDGEVAIKNAYVNLNVPVGKGIDVKLGRFDTILGMEAMDYNVNPHFTHSWGYAIEPTIHEGLLASYQLTDDLGVTAMVANTIDATSNSAGTSDGDRKTFGVAVNYVAPDNFGFLKGTTLDVAYINGKTGTGADPIQNLYVGVGIPLPVDKLSAGIAWDARQDGGGDGQTDSVLGVYLEYAASDKLTLNIRGERVEDGPALNIGSAANNTDAWDLTLTANYKLWDGVSTRLEYRHTTLDSSEGTAIDKNNNSIFANVIYEF